MIQVKDLEKFITSGALNRSHIASKKQTGTKVGSAAMDAF